MKKLGVTEEVLNHYAGTYADMMIKSIQAYSNFDKSGLGDKLKDLESVGF